MKYRTIGSNPGSRRDVSVLALGAMTFGTTVDEATSFAILDHYVEAGGTFIDTTNNYAYWIDHSRGGHSENLLGRWRRSRGIGSEVVIATKIGGRPVSAGLTFAETAQAHNVEGLSPEVIRQAAQESRRRLGVDQLDLLYSHLDDATVPLANTVEAFAGLVADGTVGLLRASNHWTWRLERARRLAAGAGLPGYEVVQYHHTYLRQRADLPGRRSPDGDQGTAGGDLLSYLRAERDLAMVAYSPLLGGGYARADKPLGPEHQHAGTTSRMAALRTVADEVGATVNQVVLSWLIGGDVPVIPLVGASTVVQLKESLAAVDLELTADQRARLDSAY